MTHLGQMPSGVHCGCLYVDVQGVHSSLRSEIAKVRCLASVVCSCELTFLFDHSFALSLLLITLFSFSFRSTHAPVDILACV